MDLEIVDESDLEQNSNSLSVLGLIAPEMRSSIASTANKRVSKYDDSIKGLSAMSAPLSLDIHATRESVTFHKKMNSSSPMMISEFESSSESDDEPE